MSDTGTLSAGWQAYQDVMAAGGMPSDAVTAAIIAALPDRNPDSSVAVYKGQTGEISTMIGSANAMIPALVCLAEHGVPVEVQEMLVRGNSSWGVKPHALAAAFSALFASSKTHPMFIVGYGLGLRDGKLEAPSPTFHLGDIVRKVKGSWWEGRVVGFYSTADNPDGVCVQLDKPNGPVQIYPAAALVLVKDEEESR